MRKLELTAGPYKGKSKDLPIVKRLRPIKTWDGFVLRPTTVDFCEHCGVLPRQQGYQDDGTTWCKMCADTGTTWCKMCADTLGDEC